MTPEGAIGRIEDHMEFCRVKYPKGVYTIEALNMVIEALKEIQQYREIGTVEECCDAMEKNRKTECQDITSVCPAYCPSCGCELSVYIGDGLYKYLTILKKCPRCDQVIQWKH